MKQTFQLLAFLLLMLSARTQIKPAGIFGDHMVLQRNKPIRVWGTASPGEKVTVSLAGKSMSAKASATGDWQVTLPAMPHGGPYTMEFAGKQKTSLTDVMIGEVWLCSGQSNMEWSVARSENAKAEIAAADHPMIRHIKIERTASLQPQKDIKPAKWQVCSPESAGNFTAAGYFFAREIQQKLGIAVGLVNSSWGGTHVETWISHEAFFSDPAFAFLKEKMPVNMEGVMADRRLKVKDQLEKLKLTLPPPSEVRTYLTVGLDDSKWQRMTLPGLWEGRGLPNTDGDVWFRRTFDIPKDLTQSGGKLSLGVLNDLDSTFVNGTFIGSTNGNNTPRSYDIPPGILQAHNQISVKVTDFYGPGGFEGEPANLALQVDKTKIPLAGDWAYRVENLTPDGSPLQPNEYATLLYNGMIHPIVGYGISGALWYQGESNAGRAAQYNVSFPLMITDWRKRWKEDFPFYFVQLTNYNANGGTSQNGGSNWAELREAQQNTLKLPNTGMAVIIDIGNSKDIHPLNKQDVGKRLALQALTKTYGMEVPCESASFVSMETADGKALLSFRNTYGLLEVRDRYGYVKGFEVAGPDRKFVYAKAYVSGEKVVVQAEGIRDHPVAVRYGWADDPADLNLFNKAGLPLAPFRTDNWPGKTADAGFGK